MRSEGLITLAFLALYLATAPALAADGNVNFAAVISHAEAEGPFVLQTAAFGTAPPRIDMQATGAMPIAPAVMQGLTPQYSETLPADDFRPASGCCNTESCNPCGGGFFVGAEYLYLRTSFSEAVAFATVTDSFSPAGLTRSVQASELDFDYDSSFRAFVGYDLGNCSDIQITYWYVDTDTAVSGQPVAGQIIVDPFGNLAVPGMDIDTSASVRLNVFDLDYVKRLNFRQNQLGLKLAAGLRAAEIDQQYDSLISAGGTMVSAGSFDANFAGLGPHFGLEGHTWHGPQSQFSLFGKMGAAILIGQYDVNSGIEVPGFAVGGQSADRLRAVPVLESELGLSWRPHSTITLSAGYMFQAWFNVGVSGGTFDGENLPVAPVDTAFGGADDGDIMSFDGLFLRAEARF